MHFLSTISLFATIMAATSAASAPERFGILVFPSFQSLDAFGPLDVLNVLSLTHKLRLSILSTTLDPVSTKPRLMNNSGSDFGESVVPTHTLATAPSDLEVLIVPGGMGTRAPAAELQPYVDFIRKRYPKLRYLITVCTGSGLAARSGVLDGKRATGNKHAWDWTTQQSDKVHWIAKARWVEHGNVWSSAGVSAGIDATFAWVAKVYGQEIADEVALGIEYTRTTYWRDDPFSGHYNLTDVYPKRGRTSEP